MKTIGKLPMNRDLQPYSNGMVKVTQRPVKPAKYRVGDAMDEYSADRLGKIAAETSRALANGLSIPVLDYHVNPTDPEGLPVTNRESSKISVGWLTGVRQADDGWLEYEFDVTNSDAAKRIQEGSIKFSSPQFTRKFTDGLDRTYGELTTHLALTPRPRNPDQGPMVMDANTAQFSLEDAMDDELDTKDEPVVPAKEPNPDIPPKPEANQKFEAVVSGLAAKGIVLPTDWTPDSDGGIDILLAAINTSLAADLKAKQDAASQAIPTESEEVAKPVQFSLDELAKLPPAVQAALKQAEKDRAATVQFSLNEAARQKETTITKLQAAKLPKGLRDKLVAMATTVQFSANGSPATLTVLQAAELFAASLPPSVQFDVADLTVVPSPDKDGQQTPEDIRKMNAEILARTGNLPVSRDQGRMVVLDPLAGQMKSTAVATPPLATAKK